MPVAVAGDPQQSGAAPWAGFPALCRSSSLPTEGPVSCAGGAVTARKQHQRGGAGVGVGGVKNLGPWHLPGHNYTDTQDAASQQRPLQALAWPGTLHPDALKPSTLGVLPPGVRLRVSGQLLPTRDLAGCPRENECWASDSLLPPGVAGQAGFSRRFETEPPGDPGGQKG